MAFKLAPLPFSTQALLPVISQETLECHYGKHHLGYLNKLNQLIVGTSWEHNESIIEIIRGSSGALFNNAAQYWNHDFYWKSLAAQETDRVVPQQLLQMAEQSFGSWNSFREQFLSQGSSFFGSGWLWLVHNGAGLELITTTNSENPLTNPQMFPLMVADLWEHAYYIDYRNDRANYLEQLFGIVNWHFADQRLHLVQAAD